MLSLFLILLPGAATVLTFLIYLLVAVMVIWLIYFIIGRLPEPIRGWANVIAIVLIVIALIYFLLSFANGGQLRY